jgi:hypothetical protein
MILFAFLFVGTILYLALVRKLLNRLETNHPATWQELGVPSLFLNNTRINNLLVLRFLWKGQYLSLQDPALTQLASRIRGLLLVLAVSFGLLIIGVVTLGAFSPRGSVV